MMVFRVSGHDRAGWPDASPAAGEGRARRGSPAAASLRFVRACAPGPVPAGCDSPAGRARSGCGSWLVTACPPNVLAFVWKEGSGTSADPTALRPQRPPPVCASALPPMRVAAQIIHSGAAHAGGPGSPVVCLARRAGSRRRRAASASLPERPGTLMVGLAPGSGGNRAGWCGRGRARAQGPPARAGHWALDRNRGPRDGGQWRRCRHGGGVLAGVAGAGGDRPDAEPLGVAGPGDRQRDHRRAGTFSAGFIRRRRQ